MSFAAALTPVLVLKLTGYFRSNDIITKLIALTVTTGMLTTYVAAAVLSRVACGSSIRPRNT